MEICIFPRVIIILLLLSVPLSVYGARVQFFKEENFKGDQLEVNSSQSCINSPATIHSFRGSVITSACVVLYSKKDCSDITSYTTAAYGYVYVLKSEEKNLRGLNFTYSGKSRHDFYVKSYRDCTEMEARAEVDFDYYERNDYAGEIARFRDICTCTTLPTSLYSMGSYRSLNTFGNCFKFYQTTTCTGTPYDTTFAITYTHFPQTMNSIKPCYLADVCKRYTTTFLNFDPIANISTVPAIKLQVQNSRNQIFINNSSNTVEQNYAVEVEIEELFQLQFPNVFNHLNLLNVTQLHPAILEAPLLEKSTSRFKTAIINGMNNLQSNWNESNIIEITSNGKFKIEGKTNTSPCTTNEMRGFVEVSEIEILYRFQIEIGGNIRNSDEKLSVIDIQSSFENLENTALTDKGTVIAELTTKMKLRLGSKSWANITQTPINQCRKQLVRLEATIINLTANNSEPNIYRQPITTKQIIENNGTSQQVDNYEAARRINETAKFQCCKELTKMKSINLLAGLKPSIEIPNPFVANAWKEIRSGLSTEYQNNSSSQEAITLEAQEEEEYRVQRKLTVAPCTRYEVNSFIEMAEVFEIPYQIQFEVTGRLGDETIEAEEIQRIMEGSKILRNKDSFTVVAQTSGKLTLTYAVGAGIDARGSPILDCRGRFMKFGASIVNLELMTNESISTLPAHKLQVAPKLIFINNSTTHQEKSFEATKDFQETALFEFTKDITQIDFIKMEDRVKSQLQNVIPFLPNVWDKLKGGFVPNRSNWNETVSFGLQNEKEFLVQDQLTLAPCMQYDVSAFIEMANDVEISYRVLMEVTGKLGPEAITAEEIRGNLKDMTFLNDKDEFTAVAETTMKLRLNYELGTGVDNAGTQMLDCLEIQAALVGNCKFTCSF